MWKPEERIKYIPTCENWPTSSEAESSLLYSNLRVGPMTLEQRTWVPAMVPWRSNEQGEVTEDVLEWYERFAKGKPGAIVVEATGIRDIPSGPLLRIGHDRYIPGLKRLADRVRSASEGKTRLLIQIIDFLNIRRRPDPEKYLTRFLPITANHRKHMAMDVADENAVREKLLELNSDELATVLTVKEWEDMQFGQRERVTDTHIPDIANLPKTLPRLFADAGHRAEQAGFDGVELHYAHAYTMASFLSATNTRNDGYGGSRENRVNLPLDVYKAVRESTGKDFAVGCRFLTDEIIEDGSKIQDACYFATAFAKAGMDFLSLSRGGKFDDAKQPKIGWAAYPYTGRSGYECMPGYISDKQGPFGRNINPSKLIRDTLHSHNVKIPIVMAGGIFNFAQAEDVLKNKQADIIGFARQSLADPDWFEKVRLGLGSEVRLCRYSNYCEGLDQKHKQVTCELWDRENLDSPNLAKSIDGRRRLVAPEWEKSNPN